MKNIHKYFIYARKSTESEDRQARSIGDQLAEVKALASKQGFEVIDILTESQSAKKPGRPVFNSMLERIERGEASGILSWHPDRLSRNALDAGRLLWLTDAGTIADLKFANYTFEPTSSGKLMLAIAFGMSKYYIDRLSEDIRRGQRQKIANGIWPQKAPLGYINNKVARTIIPDPVRAPLIRKAFELYASGNYSFAQLREVVNDLGLTSWEGKLSTSNYQHTLKNPIYTGLMRYKGEFYAGKHEPIVPKALFDACQSVMRQRRRTKRPTLKPYLYRGFFHCGECGCLITAETQKGHNYLHCTKRRQPCSQRFVREEVVQNYIGTAIQQLAVPSVDADWIISKLESERSHDATAREETLKTVRNQLAGITAKLDRLMQAYLDQTLSLDEYRKTKNKVMEEKRVTEDHLIELEKSNTTWFEPAIRFINACKQANLLMHDQNLTNQRDFFRKAGSNRKITDKLVTWQPRGAWELVVNAGRFAQDEIAASHADAAIVGEPDQHRSKRRR
jgi:site-specific DNA recombinase